MFIPCCVCKVPLTFVQVISKGDVIVMSLLLHSYVALWSVMKKKPLVCRKHHQISGDGVDVVKEHWVSCVAALHNTDLVASGKVWFIS